MPSAPRGLKRQLLPNDSESDTHLGSVERQSILSHNDFKDPCLSNFEVNLLYRRNMVINESRLEFLFHHR